MASSQTTRSTRLLWLLPSLEGFRSINWRFLKTMIHFTYFIIHSCLTIEAFKSVMIESICYCLAAEWLSLVNFAWPTVSVWNSMTHHDNPPSVCAFKRDCCGWKGVKAWVKINVNKIHSTILPFARFLLKKPGKQLCLGYINLSKFANNFFAFTTSASRFASYRMVHPAPFGRISHWMLCIGLETKATRACSSLA